MPPAARSAGGIVALEAATIAVNLRTVVYAERFRLKQLMQDQWTLSYDCCAARQFEQLDLPGSGDNRRRERR